MLLLRTQLGSTLWGHRQRQRRTLRDVSGAARVSLGYLSEVERGQKEASSELLASICDALDVELADLLDRRLEELTQYILGRLHLDLTHHDPRLASGRPPHLLGPDLPVGALGSAVAFGVSRHVEVGFA